MLGQAHIASLLRDLVNARGALDAAEQAYEEMQLCSRLVGLRTAKQNFELAIDDLMMAARAYL
jgi:hypothetical protein